MRKADDIRKSHHRWDGYRLVKDKQYNIYTIVNIRLDG